jgi:uncharacterized membrane protein YgcG
MQSNMIQTSLYTCLPGILNYTKLYFILMKYSKAGLTLSVIGIAAVLMLVLAPIAANHQTFGQLNLLPLNPFSVKYHDTAVPNSQFGTYMILQILKPANPQSTSKSSSGPSSSSSSSGGTSSSSGPSSSGGTSGLSSMHVTHVTVHHKKHKGVHSGPSGSGSSSG